MADAPGPLDGHPDSEPSAAPVSVLIDRQEDGTVWLTMSTLDEGGHPTAIAAQLDTGFRAWLATQLLRTLDRLQRVRRG